MPLAIVGLSGATITIFRIICYGIIVVITMQVSIIVTKEKRKSKREEKRVTSNRKISSNSTKAASNSCKAEYIRVESSSLYLVISTVFQHN